MEVKVKTKEIRGLMADALRLRGITGEDAAFIIDDYVEAEQEGHKTHGLSKFLMIDAGLSRKSGSIQVVKKSGCFARIEGNGELGHIAARHAAGLAVEMAREHGIGIAAFDHVSRYSRITPYAKKIAQAGFVGMLMNNGGPACVAPYGGKEPVFGTNPLCFSFPSGQGEPYVFDFATSQKVWGEIRQAMVEKRAMAPNAFLDRSGAFTRDPEQAVAAVPFGGPKGYALCFALEVMTGALIGAKMGNEAEDEFDLGYLFLAFSPDMFTSLESFQGEMDKLAAQVRDSEPAKPGDQVFVPGEIFGNQKASGQEAEEMEIEEDVYRRLQIMSSSLEGGLENNRLLN